MTKRKRYDIIDRHSERVRRVKSKKLEKVKIFSKNLLTNRKKCGIINKSPEIRLGCKRSWVIEANGVKTRRGKRWCFGQAVDYATHKAP